MGLFEKPVTDALWDARWALLYTGMISSGVAYTLQIVGQKYTEPTTATLIMSLESVFAALSGWLLLGETMTGKGTYRLRAGVRGRSAGADPAALPTLICKGKRM